MDNDTSALDAPSPPARLLERLAQVPHYTWDTSFTPFHSTFDHWHLTGILHNHPELETPQSTTASSLASAFSAKTTTSSSTRSSPRLPSRPNIRQHWSSISGASTDSEHDRTEESEPIWTAVVARVSPHMLRLEREYKNNRLLIKDLDPEGDHVFKYIDLFKLPPVPGDSTPYLVSVYEFPGDSYLRQHVDYGPAFVGLSTGRKASIDGGVRENQLPLQQFLDFAVGACECLELLHHGAHTVHGEIRQDAFHWNKATNKVRIGALGNGPRAFENILSSEGWATMSKEVGVKNKLSFIAPEQTGRLPSEPDSRTDIYSLGILFWCILSGKPAFTGETPIDIIQKVLSSRLPSVSSIRMDVPDAIAHVIQKMTMKQMDERYKSIAGLKYDLVQIQQFLGEGDQAKLSSYIVGQRDVSSFFILPSRTVGHHTEHERVCKHIEKIHRRNLSNARKSAQQSGMYGAASNSSVSESRGEGLDTIDGSDTSSSYGGRDSRSNSTTVGIDTAHTLNRPNLFASGANVVEPRNNSFNGSDRDSQFSSVYSMNNVDSLGPIGRMANRGHRNRKRGKTEVVLVVGPQGAGKSTLLKGVQSHVRKYGYYASSKFDRAKPTPFEPMLKVISSLFRQIFSERDISTPYHEQLRANLRSTWSVLHNMLDLPKTLLDPSQPIRKVNSSTESFGVRTDLPTIDPSNLLTAPTISSRDANDFLRGPASTKSIRLINTYMDVLRHMASGKALCLALDDLHSADDESVDLIVKIAEARIPVMLLLTSRPDEDTSASVRQIFDLDFGNKIDLPPLKEKHIFEYVALTMSQDTETVLPLAAVVHEKSAGNPFLMKEILQTLYEYNCLWYDWRASGWQFDLDKVFDQLSTKSEGAWGDDLISRKFAEMPHPAKCLLAWASLLGMSFSFGLIQKLCSGEFLTFAKLGENVEAADATCRKRSHFTEDQTFTSLQKLLNIGILVPGETDDEFRFSHTRYLRAANEMRECSKVDEMHFIIASAMISYLSECRYNLYPLARHIILSVDLIRARIKSRVRHRDVLWRAAQKAQESGAPKRALSSYKACIKLMQDDPWDSNHPDVFYDETLQIYVHAAELYFANGEIEEAARLLDETFKHARCSADSIRSYLLKSKVMSKKGKFRQAFEVMSECLHSLGVELPDKSWSELDMEFASLAQRLRNVDFEEFTSRPLSEDKTVVALGTVFSESLGAAYWYDARMWLLMVIEATKLALDRGLYCQVPISLILFGGAAVCRTNDVELAVSMGQLSRELMDVYDDPWTKARGLTMYTLFLSHIEHPVSGMLQVLDRALDFALTSGDRAVSILNLGCMAVSRFWAGQDLAEIESFCAYGPEEFDNWEMDLRGGTLLVATRQLVRALQGKTRIQNVETMLDDEHFNKKDWFVMCAKNNVSWARSRDVFGGIALPAFYAYGYHEKVVEIGHKMAKDGRLADLWSTRVASTTRFYTAMSLLAIAKTKPEEERSSYVEDAKIYYSKLEAWSTYNDVNYFAWLKMINAEIADVTGDYEQAVNELEAATDHCQVHGFSFEEAITMELTAEFLASRGAKRAAKVMMLEAIAAWNRINAVGKSAQLAAKHEWLIKTATTSRVMDIGVQTEPLSSLVDTDDPGLHTRRDYTSKWVEPAKPTVSRDAAQDVPGMGLDILDLTSILEFSKVISSELQINNLLEKMTSVILESVGGQAEFCAIVIDSEEHGWCVAASGNHDEGVRTYPDGIPFTEVDDQVAQQITHYILRTKETVFVHNVLDDERFSNVSDTYLARNPNGRAIICIPIIQSDHLMGVIHLEGRPNAFTQRNMVVLTLLTNQVSISLGNALLYRKVRKVSAANATMVESQRRALAAAREAEAKAKAAEAEAMHNVKLKEEAAKAKSIFLANVSHELRTPLNGVIGMSELLKGTMLTKDQEGYADSIRVCADTLLTVINDILDFSKLEAGKMQMFTVPLNLKETITEVVRALAYTNQEHGLQTIEDLGTLDDNLVLGDPVRLHQIFMNLLSNAYKFTPKGSVTVRAVKIAETSTKVKVQCSVEDTGIGITTEQLTRLFQPFSQADSSTARSYGGSGLGLSICKAMIENVLGGKIWIESKPSVGTKVFFSLTFQKAPKNSAASKGVEVAVRDPDPMATWSQSKLVDNGEDTKGFPTNGQVNGSSQPRQNFCDLSKVSKEDIRVCIAEDNVINRKIAISYVTKIGLYCEAYEDGKLAYEALQKRSKEGKPFHLVLMDVQMPVLDGYEATKAIRKDQDENVRGVLIIAMTASAIRGDREKCLEAGMNDYLAKPVRQTALRGMIDEYMSGSKEATAIINSGTEPETTTTPGDKVSGDSRAHMKSTAPAVSRSPDLVKHDSDPSSSKNAERSSSKLSNGTSVKDADTTKKSSLANGQQSNGTSGDMQRTSSPPSGVKETELLGKISTEIAAPQQSGTSKVEVEEALSKTHSEGMRAKERLRQESANQNGAVTHDEKATSDQSTDTSSDGMATPIPTSSKAKSPLRDQDLS